MSDRNWKALRAREENIDGRVREARVAGLSSDLRAARLEKTIIVAAAAIVEAIWKART